MTIIDGRFADLKEEDAFSMFMHKFCQTEDSPLLRGNKISALEFMDVWGAIVATDDLAIGGKYTLEEVVGEDNWRLWSDQKRFNAQFVVAELIKRRLVILAVSSAPYEPTRYELNYTGSLD